MIAYFFPIFRYIFLSSNKNRTIQVSRYVVSLYNIYMHAYMYMYTAAEKLKTYVHVPGKEVNVM